MQIENRTFLVTGAASGLGAATARMLIENGGNVVLVDLVPTCGEALSCAGSGRKLASLPLILRARKKAELLLK
jgi:NAD(P)-dependent dehydrogenase (short-subunit alcohol dehydrogenase family)